MIFIRADANNYIGTGHVMRCLSLAHVFAERGEEVLFVTADHRGDFLIHSSGFDSICLNSDWTRMEEEELGRAASVYSPEILLIDSYYVTEKYFYEARGFAPVVYIDDMNAALWDVDCLINYNIFSTALDYSAYRKTNIKLLLGPAYAPLRREFKDLPKHVINEKISNILVSAGGADPEGITMKFMKEICPNWPDVSFHFVVGALNPKIEEIKSITAGNTVLHINERNMSGLMMSCDMAVSAAGTTMYEMCACGIPTIAYTLADNQIIAAEQFEKQKIMVNAGDCRNNDGFMMKIGSCIQDLSEHYEMRRNMSQNMQSLVDGFGADRIVDRII